MIEQERKLKVYWIFVNGFFLSLYYSVISYSASTFLAGLIHIENIWILYATGSFLALIMNFSVSKLLRNINVNKLFIHTSVLATFSVFCLSFSESTLAICLEFILYYSLSALLYTLSSIILKEFSKDQSTGTIRGYYDAMMSSGYLLAPFIASIFILNYGIKSIFYISTFFGAVTILIFYFYIRVVPELSIKKNNFSMDMKKLWRNYDLKYIIYSQLGLSTYYSLIVIYMPFKLATVGITLTQYLSVILPVALTPFLFMPPLLGVLEDKVSNEKEVLILAYFGLILSLILIAFCDSTSILTWTALIFFSRFCASSVEISNLSYFYKKVDMNDVSIISIYNSTDYFCGMFFTGIFALLLLATDLKTLFLSVSFFLCFMLVYISKIHDTKNYEKHQNIQKEWKDIWRRSTKRTKRGIAI